ncbi:hypothetical protein Csa_023124 [Cucumis sativus]|uniref:Uncharacterized protein n=1 Tax=Cucumis sativus TaxID=3659 RepID=A0A0A0KR47_CUCSA|nr:hypothetical protein Csa_023124 [Cucumis sativus]
MHPKEPKPTPPLSFHGLHFYQSPCLFGSHGIPTTSSSPNKNHTPISLLPLLPLLLLPPLICHCFPSQFVLGDDG